MYKCTRCVSPCALKHKSGETIRYLEVEDALKHLTAARVVPFRCPVCKQDLYVQELTSALGWVFHKRVNNHVYDRLKDTQAHNSQSLKSGYNRAISHPCPRCNSPRINSSHQCVRIAPQASLSA